MLVLDTSRLNDLLFQTHTKLFDLKKQEEQWHADIRGLESAKSLIVSHVQEIQKELLFQQEIMDKKVYDFTTV
jgi:hypothetical protein